MSTIAGSYELALHVLQTASSTFDARIEALRFLQVYVDGKSQVDSMTRRRINQAVLEGVLEIVLSENSSDLRKRQLMRTECFLILANLLDSKALFGDTEKKLAEIISANVEREEMLTKSRILKSSHRPLATSKSLPKLSRSQNSSDFLNELGSQSLLQQLPEVEMAVSPDIDELSKIYRTDGTFDKAERLRKSKLGDRRLAQKSPAELSLLKNDLVYHSKLLITDKRLKPRPSVFYDGQYQADNFVPGVKSTDWYEQDRKLGYQKSRMWFPVAGLGINNDLAPTDRPGPEEHVAPDRVVREYMQMRALLSYVGDVVAPFHHEPTGSVAASTIPMGGLSKRLHGVTEPNRFQEALKQAVSVWTPLVGSHLPEWVRKKKRWTDENKHAVDARNAKDLIAAAAKFADGENSLTSMDTATLTGSSVSSDALESAYGSQSKTSSSTRSKKHNAEMSDANAIAHTVERRIMLTKGVLRKLLRKELKGARATSETLRETLEGLIEKDTIGGSTVTKYQKKIENNLQAQKDSYLASMEGFRNLAHETIKLQYAQLPQRYLLIIDGKRANSRRLVGQLITIFCRTRRMALLSLFFGTWKICLVEAASLANRPKYAKTAACHLMNAWVIHRKFKRMRNWIRRWQKEVVLRIFYERDKAVVPIQTMYRFWRDRQKFLRLHQVAPYNGPLSDIYLAMFRPNVKYYFSRRVRDSRHMLWMAAIIIQKTYRCVVVYREYIVRIKQIILIQSMGRMYPRRLWFLKLRATAIKCQAWMRRTVKRKQYLRLKHATIIVQKYVRRYLSILLKGRLFLRGWVHLENRKYAAIRIQCRFRVFRAKKRVRKIIFNRKERVWAALVIQKYWYHHKGAFHTYLLMCCYRTIDELNVEFNKFIKARWHDKTTRKIQEIYKDRYFRRIVTSAVKLQCWYRGRCGYTAVDRLRRIKWAARKLHHWARGMMRKKHALVRKIQRWWWRRKPGRLRRHLEYRTKMMDQEDDRILADLHYRSATILQAFVHGVWCRRWAKLYKAAVKIQRPLKFYLARQRWKREKRMRVVRVIKRYVDNFVDRAVKDRAFLLVRLHEKMLIKPQALARGYIVRKILYNARTYAFRFGLAVVKVQRFWRRTGSMGKAVEEVMAMRRLELNPFVSCTCLHEVILEVKKKTSRYFGMMDARCGMRVPELLSRLGCLDILPMFPRKQFLYAYDLRPLTQTKLSQMFVAWQEGITKKKGASSGGKKEPGGKKEEPKFAFRALLEVTRPRMNSRKPLQIEALQNIAPIQEIMAAGEFNDFMIKSFTKRYGRQLQARAQNLARTLTESLWLNFNNYKGVTDVVTKAQILRAFATSSDSAGVKTTLDEMRSNLKRSDDDAAWDRERVKLCAELLQLAIDRAQQILPATSFLCKMIERATLRVASYKRKFAYVLARIKKRAKEALKKGNSKKPKAKPVVVVSDPSSSEESNPSDFWTMTPEQLSRKLSAEDCCDLPFLGSNEQIELEINVSVCKLYLAVLDKLYIATCGVQSIKSVWFNNALKRFNAKARLKAFLEKESKAYKHQRETDHVKVVWNKFRRGETNAKRLTMLLESIAQKKEAILWELAYVPRYGWALSYDEQGVLMYVDEMNQTEPTYEPQVYSIEQYKKVLQLQRVFRIFLAALAERRRLKEEARLCAIAEEEARWERERFLGERAVATTVTLQPRNLRVFMSESDAAAMQTISSQQGAGNGGQGGGQMQSPESLLPWRLQLHPEPALVSGSWAFLQSEDKNSFDIVVLFKVREHGTVCDAKSVKSKKYVNVRKERIFQMNIEKGSLIEARYKGELDFYRGFVTAIIDAFDGSKRYSVEYEDGERENNLTRDMLRFPSKSLELFLAERTVMLAALTKRFQRMQHYAGMKERRVDSCKQLAASASMRFEQAWSATGADFSSALSVVTATATSVSGISVSGSASVDGGSVQGSLVTKGSLNSGSGSVSGISPTNSKASAKKGNRKASSSAAAEPVFTGPPPLISNVKAMLVSSQELLGVQNNSLRVSVKYVRRPLRYGWSIDRSGPETVYRNSETLEETTIPPRYTAGEEFCARKLQSVAKMKIAKIVFKALLLKDSVDSIVNKAVMRGRKLGYVGYRLEGASCTQLLHRLGYFGLADAIELTLKEKDLIDNLTIEKFLATDTEKLELYGIQSVTLKKSFGALKAWWSSATTTEDRLAGMSWANYFSSVDDPRSIHECVRDSQPELTTRFLKVFTSGKGRSTEALKAMFESNYPITYQQFDSYLKRYSGNVELARARLGEITHKATTNTWVEEEQVFKVFRSAVRRLGVIMGNLKLRLIRTNISSVEKHADELFASRESIQGPGRLLITGPEAKAALLLRRDGLEYMRRCVKATIVIQRRVRGFVRRSVFLKLLDTRQKSMALLKRVGRGYLGRKIAGQLVLQQMASWEQLWDTKRSMVYFYNRETLKSTYVSPEGEPVRPLVRDRLSDTLMQAWPHLDAARGGSLMAGGIAGSVLDGTGAMVLFKPTEQCSVCTIRQCVRHCRDCFDPEIAEMPDPEKPVPYCFPCFNKFHADDPERVNHRYDDAALRALDERVASDGFIHCCMCDEPATRKCLGILDDASIDKLCGDLQRATSEKWHGILLNANVGSEGKLSLLLGVLNIQPGQKMMTTAQLQQVRTALERTRAECDECYCATCYTKVHAGGKRSMHRWVGFRAGGPVCNVCVRSPAELSCTDCENVFCSSCFAVFHSMGRKRRHRNEKIVEDMSAADVLCEVCSRRAGSISCDNPGCEVQSCDSCYEFVHRIKCSFAPKVHTIAFVGIDATATAGSPVRPSTTGPAASPPRANQAMAKAGEVMCVGCGEEADQKCVQCSDYYCSKTWMGNPGCFAKFHTKGNRLTHKTLPLEKPNDGKDDTTTSRSGRSPVRGDSKSTIDSKTVGSGSLPGSKGSRGGAGDRGKGKRRGASAETVLSGTSSRTSSA